MPTLTLSEKGNTQLQQLSKKRKAEDSTINSKKNIAEELIDKAHKREVKSWVHIIQNSKSGNM